MAENKTKIRADTHEQKKNQKPKATIEKNLKTTLWIAKIINNNFVTCTQIVKLKPESTIFYSNCFAET